MIRTLLNDFRTSPWFAFAWISWLLFDGYLVAIQSGWVPCP